MLLLRWGLDRGGTLTAASRVLYKTPGPTGETLMAYILSLDQGTTSSRSILFGKDGAIVAHGQREFKQIYPQGGWVEHDPYDILTSQMSSVVEVLGQAGIRPRDLAAVGITNQRETTIVWDRETGKPVYNAIVWQDRRTAERCRQMKNDG